MQNLCLAHLAQCGVLEVVHIVARVRVPFLLRAEYCLVVGTEPVRGLCFAGDGRSSRLLLVSLLSATGVQRFLRLTSSPSGDVPRSGTAGPCGRSELVF